MSIVQYDISLVMKLYNLYTSDVKKQREGIQEFRDLFADKLLEEFGPIFKKRLLGMTAKVVPIKAARKFEDLLLQYEFLTYQFILFAEKELHFGIAFWHQAKSFHDDVFQRLEKRLKEIWQIYNVPEYYDLLCKSHLEDHRQRLKAYIKELEPRILSHC